MKPTSSYHESQKSHGHTPRSRINRQIMCTVAFVRFLLVHVQSLLSPVLIRFNDLDRISTWMDSSPIPTAAAWCRGPPGWRSWVAWIWAPMGQSPQQRGSRHSRLRSSCRVGWRWFLGLVEGTPKPKKLGEGSALDARRTLVGAACFRFLLILISPEDMAGVSASQV